MLFGGLEAGGTKMICAIGDENGNIIDQIKFKTEAPKISMPKMIEYFKKFDIKGLGISCFGPIDINKKHDTYGYILKTTKEKWAMTNIVGMFKEALNIPVTLDTDVNGACLAEATYGAGKDRENVVYFTVGTGIGVGVYLNGRLHHGTMHTEGGHMFVNKHIDDNYEGCCIFHKNCLEGMASGPAIEKRFGQKAENIKDTKQLIELESHYLAQGVLNAILMYSPDKIILGGGVMHVDGLIEEIRRKTVEFLNGYVQTKEVLEDIDNYVVLPSLKDNAGILGSIRLASLDYFANN